MTKPEKQIVEYFDYNQAQSFIKHKYNHSHRHFWVWLCNNKEISNNSLIDIHTLDDLDKERIVKKHGQSVCDAICKSIELFKKEFENAKFMIRW